jgi:quinol-cytochrome oxidoreductase complex cytochrome b subunit/mono/diheme cytochrome c family protein
MQTTSEKSSRPGFWEERTGWHRLKQVLFLEPLPGGARWSAAFRSLLLFVFALQVLTGILLTTSYAPSVDTAYPSVKYIQEEVPLGGFIRALHHWGSSAMVVLLLFHLVQVFVWGAYKKPRELTWMVGVLLLACTLGLAFTGYLLPWDERAYWATKVGLGIAGTVPGIGDGLRTLLQGGPQMGNLTLTRFFTLHGFLLPGLVIFLVVVHLYLFRLHGVTPTWGQSPAQLRAAEEPFWPRQVLMDAVLALAFLVGLGLWCLYHPAPLERQADPATPYEARPEWYFMFLFQLLRYFKGPYEVVGTFVLPLAFFLVLFFWPLLDRNPHRDPRRRPVALALLGAGTAGLVGLTVFATLTDVRMQEPALAAAPTPPPAPPAGPIQRADVARTYNDTCAACHGVDGTGRLIRPGMPTIPDFTSLAWQMAQTDLEILHRIHDGNEPLMPAYRDKLSEPQQLALAVYVRAFGVAPAEPAAARPGEPPAPPKPAPPPAAAPVAAQMPAELVYRNFCLACHDSDGRGTTVRKAMPEVPDFTDARWAALRTDADLKQSILDGKGKFMLPMKDRLGPADAERMVGYVRAFRGGKQVVEVAPKPPAPPPAHPAVVPGPGPAATAPLPPTPAAQSAARMSAAAGLFRQYCLVCHGADGRGTATRPGMPPIPDFTDRAWQATVNDPRLAVSILEGKGTLMPAFRGRVGEDQVDDLVAYVRAFGPEGATALGPAPGAGEFETRYRQLQAEWDELEKRMRELRQPPKP